MEPLVLVLTVFVGLVAISQVGQMWALIQLQRRAREMQRQIASLTPRAESLLESARQTIDDSRRQINEVAAKASEILDSAKTQMGRAEGLLTDVTTRARAQLDRAELVLDDTIGRVHETVAVLHNGVMRPLKEINGISAGIRAAIAHMIRGGRPSVAQATHDEEMFI